MSASDALATGTLLLQAPQLPAAASAARLLGAPIRRLLLPFQQYDLVVLANNSLGFSAPAALTDISRFVTFSDSISLPPSLRPLPTLIRFSNFIPFSFSFSLLFFLKFFFLKFASACLLLRKDFHLGLLKLVDPTMQRKVEI